jgi:CspA family cold shock protein
MGKYRDHRQPRSHGIESSLSPAESEPSYFQRRPTAPPPATSPDASAQAHDAELLWFNVEKGFGFVRLSDGSDAFLHGSKLQAAGLSNLSQGAHLVLRTELGHKGPQVVEVLSVSTGNGGGATAAPATRFGPEPGAEKPQPEGPESVGVVKRYDAVKGFGFITVEGVDVFVHATTLTRSGLTALEAGQNVALRYGRGPKGHEVRSIRLV